MIWTARHTECRPMSRNTISRHQWTFARQSLHPWPIVQSRLQHSDPLFMLLTFTLTRSDRLSIELFGVHKNSTNTFRTDSKATGGTLILQWKRKLVSFSFWVWLRSLATMNINVVKLSLNGKSLSAFHSVSSRLCVRIQKFHTCCLSISILLSHVGKILVLSFLSAQSGHRQHLHPRFLQALQEQWELADPLDLLDVSFSCSVKLTESPEEHTLNSLDEAGFQRISQIL